MSHGRRNSLLVVCYYFPPLGMGGVQRPVLLASRMARLGWDVSVLTVRPFRYPAYDLSLLEKLPRKIRIMRASSVEQLLQRIMPGGKARIGKPADPQARPLSEWIVLPDNKAPAACAFLMRIAEIFRAVRPSAVITSSPPPSIHFVGWYLRKYFGVKWIADYRDVWFSQSRLSCKTRHHVRIHEYLQRAFVEKADRTIVVTDAHLDYLKKEYADATGRIHLIPNGYDEEMFGGNHAARAGTGVFRIGYCGTLNHLTYVPGMFEMLIGVSRFSRIAIDLCGVVSCDIRSDIDKIDPGREIVHLRGYKNHRDAVDFRMDCDANLITLAPGRRLDMIIPGKVYETLRTPRPVIGIVPRDSAAWRLLSRFDNVTLVDAADPAGSREAVEELVRRGEVDLPKRSGVEEYDWDELAVKYDRILMEVTA